MRVDNSNLDLDEVLGVLMDGMHVLLERVESIEDRLGSLESGLYDEVSSIRREAEYINSKLGESGF